MRHRKLDPASPATTLLPVRDVEAMALLKRVSRSFYLSVKWLPAPMRRGICLGYLLARASDTLADSQDDPSLLDAFEACLLSKNVDYLRVPATHPSDPGEAQLLSELPSVFMALCKLPEQQTKLIEEVVAIIISGQRLDMQRFINASADHVISLASPAELEDYTWRVAGCVGQFWTRLGFLTLGDAFSEASPDWLETHGIRFGQGLQLVNILRDTHEDLKLGRNYLPTERADWAIKAQENLESGLIYARAMRLRRLHIAVSLPARIGIDTLDALAKAGPLALETRIKIPRSHVWRHFAAACKSSLSPARR